MFAVLRDNALKAELACMRKDRRAVALDVLSELDPGRRLGEQLFEPGLARVERSRAPVLSIELEQARLRGLLRRLPERNQARGGRRGTP